MNIRVLSLLQDEGISPESRDRVNAACQELSRLGGWTVPDLLLYLHDQDETREEEGDGVTCCTIHSFKGREAKHIIVVGCEEGIIPNGRKDEDIEESRRLMFVAMTRAKDTLTMTWVAARPQWRGENIPLGPMQPREPSRFLKEAIAV